GCARRVEFASEVAAFPRKLFDPPYIEPGTTEDGIALTLVILGRDGVLVRDRIGAELGIVLGPRAFGGLGEQRHEILPARTIASIYRNENPVSAPSMSIYYDPYDFDIDTDPYPVWKQLRDEQPLYYNERYDFFALSRFDDVERASVDWKTYSSARGTILELIKSDFQLPPGSIIFEDPPAHDIHRSLLARVFTPRKVSALEPKIREFCARSLDPLVGAGGFDFIADLGAQMPMRTIGMLLGVPEQDQEAIRDSIDAGLRLEDGDMPELDE